MSLHSRLVLLTTMVLIGGGCDSGATDGSNPCADLGDNPNGSMTALIGSERFAANCFVVRASDNGVSIDARALIRNDDFGIQSLGEIEISLDEGASSEIGNTYRARLTTRRGTQVDAATGTASLDVLASDRVAGTFRFTTENGIEVTDGDFDIDL